MTQQMICIQCPMGCQLTATEENGEIRVTGNACKRGEIYAREELTAPRRVVTCLVRVEGSPEPLSVKTEGGVPKEKIFDCIREIKSLRLSSPVAIGTVVLDDVCGTGVCVRATKSV